MEPLDRIAETLAAHQVNFVVIGNYGAQLHGVEVQTQDADMTDRAKDHLSLEDLRRFRDKQREHGAERE